MTTTAGEPPNLLEAARGALREQRPAVAAELCERLLARNPRQTEALYLHGFARAAEGKFDEALRSLERIPVADPLAPQSLLARARILRLLARCDESAACCEQAVACAGPQAAFLMEIGDLLHDLHRYEAALHSYGRAIATDPALVAAYNNRGNTLRVLGRHVEAIADYDTAIASGAQLPQAHCNRGNALTALGRHAEAVTSYAEALRQRPGYANALAGQGVALAALERSDEALASLTAALALDPTLTAARMAQGSVLAGQLRYAEALAVFEAVLAQQPTSWEARNNRGNVLMRLGRCAEALADFDAALDSAGERPELLSHRGNALHALSRYEEALASHERAIALAGDRADLLINCANTLLQLGRYDDALLCWSRALAAEPENREARFNAGLCHLLRGEFVSGWPAYELRFVVEDAEASQGRRALALTVAGDDVTPGARRWQGESLQGQSLLILSEQGLGDEIMFASIFSEIIAEAQHCTIEASPRLVPLFARSFPGARVIARDERGMPAAGAPADVWIPAGSLAGQRRLRRTDFPSHQGYLLPDAGRVAAWRARLAELGPGLRIGLSWRGGTPRTGLLRRSLPLARLAPLLAVPGTRFVSLQYTDCEQELALLETGGGPRVQHWPDVLVDYDETAALVAALDLVISVCTAVVHLTGALGRPVWILAPHVPEWRYGLESETLAWYPAARVFRQSRPGDWDSVLARVAAALERFVAGTS